MSEDVTVCFFVFSWDQFRANYVPCSKSNAMQKFWACFFLICISMLVRERKRETGVCLMCPGWKRTSLSAPGQIKVILGQCVHNKVLLDLRSNALKDQKKTQGIEHMHSAIWRHLSSKQHHVQACQIWIQNDSELLNRHQQLNFRDPEQTSFKMQITQTLI